ncbi:MAG: cobalamin/Fe(3+)-siderophore ABC transporter ATP-binding protein, partial [Gammaproteobacteria bacterium]|nr:cobalamin/Fe(3+)-siderophore ABC transporter ATP-binding protein [Gammaproteobacteria bacterium]
MSDAIITPPGEPVLSAEGLWVKYDGTPAVKDITLSIPGNRVVAFIG